MSSAKTVIALALIGSVASSMLLGCLVFTGPALADSRDSHHCSGVFQWHAGGYSLVDGSLDDKDLSVCNIRGADEARVRKVCPEGSRCEIWGSVGAAEITHITAIRRIKEVDATPAEARASAQHKDIQLVQDCGWYAIFGCDADNPHVDGPGHTIWTSDYSNFRHGYYCNVLGPSSHGVAVRNAHINGGYARSGCLNQKRGDDEEARAITLVRAKAPSVKYLMRKGVKVIFDDIKRKDECLYELAAREDHPGHTVRINTYEVDICNNTIKAMD